MEEYILRWKMSKINITIYNTTCNSKFAWPNQKYSDKTVAVEHYDEVVAENISPDIFG